MLFCQFYSPDVSPPTVRRSARQTMFQNRDYVFDRSYHVDRRARQMTIVSRCAARGDCPERPGVVRVNNYWSVMVIRPHTRFDEVSRSDGCGAGGVRARYFVVRGRPVYD